jgi:signal peptidase II
MKKIIVLLLLSLVCVGCDQGTKYTARYYLEGRQTLSYMGDFFRLSYTENSGGFLNLGATLPGNIRQIIFIMVVAIVLTGFMVFVIRQKKLDGLALFSSAMIIGGGLGNLIDRIINQGLVIDFMNLGIGPIRTGIFNVADVAIMFGTFMFAIVFIRKSYDQKVETDS